MCHNLKGELLFQDCMYVCMYCVLTEPTFLSSSLISWPANNPINFCINFWASHDGFSKYLYHTITEETHGFYNMWKASIATTSGSER